MRISTTLINTVLTVALGLASQSASGQCDQSIGVSGVSVNQEALLGAFNLSVSGNKSFTGELIRISGTEQNKVQDFAGMGSRTIQFKDLDISGESFYRVVVAFEGEQSFICKRKVQDIDFLTLHKQ